MKLEIEGEEISSYVLYLHLAPVNDDHEITLNHSSVCAQDRQCVVSLGIKDVDPPGESIYN